MQNGRRISTELGAAMLALAAFAGSKGYAADAAQSGPVVMGTWRHHSVSFNYFGITSLYSCDGLENDIRSILLHLGARKDAKVNATGCARGPSVPSHNALIRADFYTLAPSSDATDVVQAQWVPLVLSPKKPYFMDNGDCEVIDQMKDVVSKNFSLRDLAYRTDCVPHELITDSFSIKAQVLRPLPAVAAKG